MNSNQQYTHLIGNSNHEKRVTKFLKTKSRPKLINSAGKKISLLKSKVFHSLSFFFKFIFTCISKFKREGKNKVYHNSVKILSFSAPSTMMSVCV